MIFAIFNLSGNIPVVSIWFTMSVIGLTRFSLIELSNVFDNPSHPVLNHLSVCYEFKGKIVIILIY